MIELTKISWVDAKKFEAMVAKMGEDLVLEEQDVVVEVGRDERNSRRRLEKARRERKTMVVPSLVGKRGERCLRIKWVEKEEADHLRSTKEMEWVNEGKVEFFFGSEPRNLKNKFAYGTLVSYWAEDEKVTKLRMSYAFAEVAHGVLGKGFGSRASVPSVGSNSYFKKFGRGTDATTSSPAQADNERREHQYFRAKEHKNQLMQPMFRRMVNELSKNVLDAGKNANPNLMQMVGTVCDRQILTLGHIPYKRGQPKETGIIEGGSNNPALGFGNGGHVDYCDILSIEQVEEWKKEAERKGWVRCVKLLENKDFCLPTNCGYQFVFKERERERTNFK